MAMTKSIITQQVMKGPLARHGVLRSKDAQKKLSFEFSLNLTALIDAFSILVIFLLSNYNGDSKQLDLSHKMVLPSATQSESISGGVAVIVNSDHFVIEGKKVNQQQLFQELVRIKKEGQESENGLVIQADQRMSYQDLSPVLAAGAQAGYDKYKFAVLPAAEKTGVDRK